jgi:hypothetical protein
MILRVPQGADALSRLIDDLKPKVVRDETHPPEEGIVREIEWELRPGVFLCYAEDVRSGSAAVAVMSEDEAQAVAYAELVERALPLVGYEELLGAVDVATTEDERAWAVARIGFGAPYDYDERFFARIRDAMHDDSGWVRTAAVWATTYSFWPDFQELLEEIARDNRDPRLQEEARMIAGAIRDQHSPIRKDEVE